MKSLWEASNFLHIRKLRKHQSRPLNIYFVGRPERVLLYLQLWPCLLCMLLKNFGATRCKQKIRKVQATKIAFFQEGCVCMLVYSMIGWGCATCKQRAPIWCDQSVVSYDAWSTYIYQVTWLQVPLWVKKFNNGRLSFKVPQVWRCSACSFACLLQTFISSYHIATSPSFKFQNELRSLSLLHTTFFDGGT